MTEHRGATRVEPRAALLAAVVLLGWIAIVFHPIVLLRAVNVQNDIFTSDLLNDRLPMRAFAGRSYGEGKLPIWTPGIYTGFPVLAQVEVGSLYPTNVALFTLLEPYTAIAYAQLLPLFIAGLGTSALALSFGLPVAAAILAGGGIALSGFFVCHIRQLNMIDAACWFPWLLLLVDRLAQGGSRRTALWLSVIWALSLLAGHPQVSYYAGLVLAGWFLVRAAQEGRRRGGSYPRVLTRALLAPGARWVAAGISIGTLIAAAALVPAAELASLSGRKGGLPYATAAAYPVDPRAFWSFFAPYVNGDASNATFRSSGIFWEQYGYLGLLPMLLAIFAVVTERRDPRVRLLLGLALVTYLMVLGDNTPLFYFAYHWVPGMAYFRFPTRFLLFVEVAVSLLAAFGFAHVLRQLKSRVAYAVLIVIVLGSTAADLWHHQRRQLPLAERETWTQPVETAALLERASEGDERPWRYFTPDAKRLHAHVYRLSKGWSGDLSHYVAFRDLLQPSANLLFGFESADGYANLVPRYVEAIWGSEKDSGLVTPSGRSAGDTWELAPHVQRLLRLFNVRYVLSAWPLRSEHMRKIATTSEGVFVYESRNTLPRAFIVGSVRETDSDREALRLLADGGFDPAREALVHDAGITLPRNARSSSKVRVAERGTDFVRLEASSEHPGFLVLSETHYPGWIATVDGRERAVHRTNMMMRGLVLEAGAHDVVFRFRSTTLATGFVLSALGLATLGVLAFGEWRSRRRRMTGPR